MKKVLIAFIAVFNGLISNGQSLIKIPFGSTPIMDGVVAVHEWEDAGTVNIEISGGSKKVEVLFKHDSTNLHIAYLRNLESSMIRFPELTLDINNSKSNIWEADDWWFHVSATDCEYQGASDNYSNCQVVRPNWIGIPNISPGTPVTDTIEIRVPLSTVGIDISTVDTIGISFIVSNTISILEQWPISSNKGNPSTWANAIFMPKATSSLVERNKQTSIIDIFPNPSKGLVNVTVVGIKEKFSIKVVDVLGKTIFLQDFDGLNPYNNAQIDLSKERSSVYLLQVSSDQDVHTERILVQ